MSTFWMAYGCLGCLPAQRSDEVVSSKSRSLSPLSLVSGLDSKVSGCNAVYIPVIALSHATSHDIGSHQSDWTSLTL